VEVSKCNRCGREAFVRLDEDSGTMLCDRCYYGSDDVDGVETDGY
jgi:hypothetical protein